MNKKGFIALLRQTIAREEETLTMFDLEYSAFLQNMNRLLDSMEEDVVDGNT